MAAQAAAGTWVLVLSLWGAAAIVSSRNVTARMGEPLVLNCKGAPKKPPQELEWKLNTGRTEAWKVLSPQGAPWDSVAHILPNGSLLLPAVGIQDEGTFRCRATNRHGKETKSSYRVRVYQIPAKPEIIDPASELTAGVPNKVGTCVSEGSYPAGTLSWHLDGKPLTPDGKEPVSPENVQLVVEPEGGAVALGGTVTLTCEAPAQAASEIHWVKDGAPLPLPASAVLLLPEVGPQDQGSYSCVATSPSHGSQESPAVRVRITETDEVGQSPGSMEGSGLRTLALALGTLAALGIVALLIGVVMWQRRRQGKERKAPESQEEEEERAELNQSEEPETAESGAGGP
ncbi:advanced glycosylation end product-specific receptor isoform X2 [Octodon degus]|uniref:Advanced glycosylation end product-specific receptor isoform X2 n=1 Tax=Octodon degus TaxID=10160 RepID=A0A6P6EYJ8_OCTDE|nr:advanced glycosylation end product-specific receptor isoform X2 [Octodon degus]